MYPDHRFEEEGNIELCTALGLRAGFAINDVTILRVDCNQLPKGFVASGLINHRSSRERSEDKRTISRESQNRRITGKGKASVSKRNAVRKYVSRETFAVKISYMF